MNATGNSGTNADIKIGTLEDWQQFRKDDLDVIVDPMVFRVADVFFRGRSGARDTLPVADAGQIWSALSGDLGSLSAFFDQIILADRLPLIDYGITFESTLDYNTPWICQVVNEELHDRVVYTVHVWGEVSKKARAAALAALLDRPAAPPELEKEVLKHLNVLDYRWQPNLSVGNNPELEKEVVEQLNVPDYKRQADVTALQNLAGDDLKLAHFLYGGLVFSASSQMSGSNHVLQAKRWRLATAMSIGAVSVAQEYEQELVAELDRRIRSNPQYTDVRFNPLPAFLPYILAKNPQTPLDLLRIVKDLRKDDAITDSRDWRRQLIRNWVDKGRIEQSDEKDIKRILLRLHKRLDVDQQ